MQSHSHNTSFHTTVFPYLQGQVYFLRRMFKLNYNRQIFNDALKLEVIHTFNKNDTNSD